MPLNPRCTWPPQEPGWTGGCALRVFRNLSLPLRRALLTIASHVKCQMTHHDEKNISSCEHTYNFNIVDFSSPFGVLYPFQHSSTLWCLPPRLQRLCRGKKLTDNMWTAPNYIKEDNNKFSTVLSDWIIQSMHVHVPALTEAWASVNVSAPLKMRYCFVTA